MSVLRNIAFLAVLVAVLWQPVLIPGFEWLVTWPLDEDIGHIPTLTPEELSYLYENKTALLVGGTRGMGFGTSLALVRAGAHVSLVGREESTGQATVAKLKAVAPNPEHQRIRYQQGDLGSVRAALELLDTLKQSNHRYNFLVVSAGVFPNWSFLKNDDGLEWSFAIGVVGRFLLYRYRHMYHFLSPSARVLNILASGMMIPWI